LELTKAVKTSDTAAKEAIQKAELSVDEGAKALAVWQKHIKFADHLDLSWATVKHYMAHPLADGPEDEKDIARSEKEAWKEPKPRKAMGEVEVEKGSRKGCSKWNTIMSRMETMREGSDMFLQLPIDPGCWGRAFVVVHLPVHLHSSTIRGVGQAHVNW